MQIQERLKKEDYHKVVVSDLGTFPQCINKNTKEGRDSEAAYKAWKGAGGSHQALLIPPKSANSFVHTAKTMNGKDPRVSECSNFAYHGVGVLLDDPDIRSQYNVAIAGVMGGRHNIAIMVPIGHEIPKPTPRDYKLPPGSLIVDPWAVGMGHPANRSLAVPEKDYAYKGSLYDNLTVHYQSKLDPKIAELPANKTLKEFHGSPQSQAAHNPAPTTSSPQTQAPQTRAPQTQAPLVLPSSYNTMWNSAKKEAVAQGKTGDSVTMDQMKKILNDYTKDNSWFKRVTSGHWNRHHIKEVNDIVVDMTKGKLTKPSEVMAALEKIENNQSKQVNPTGDFKKSISFMKEQLKTAQAEPEEPSHQQGARHQ